MDYRKKYMTPGEAFGRLFFATASVALGLLVFWIAMNIWQMQTDEALQTESLDWPMGLVGLIFSLAGGLAFVLAWLLVSPLWRHVRQHRQSERAKEIHDRIRSQYKQDLSSFDPMTGRGAH